MFGKVFEKKNELRIKLNELKEKYLYRLKSRSKDFKKRMNRIKIDKKKVAENKILEKEFFDDIQEYLPENK